MSIKANIISGNSIHIPLGTRATLAKFRQAYTVSFLADKGMQHYNVLGTLSENSILFTIQTSHGEVVVHDFDKLTYLGHKTWDVRFKSEESNE